MQTGRMRWVAIVLVILGAASYGMLSPLVKLAYQDGWNDAQVSAGQITMGAVLMWLVTAMNRKSWVNPFRGPWIRLSLIGVLGIALTTVLYNLALSELDASLAIILLFQFTWITIVMESAARRRLPTRFQMLAVLVILLGTLLSVNVLHIDWTRFSLRGLLFGLSASFTYSLFLFGTGRLQTAMPSLMKSAVMLTAALPFLYILYPPVGLFEGSYAGMLYWGTALGLLGQVIPTVFFNIGIPRIGGSLSALLGAMELPVALVGALLILGESIGGWQWLGMALIIGGIVVSEWGAAGENSSA